jgi:hypothetical protein
MPWTEITRPDYWRVPGEFLFTAQVRFVKTSIAADILGFEVSRAKQLIRPGQMLR